MELTPKGSQGWTWKDRLAEIILQPIAWVVFTPIVWVHNFTGWVLDKIFNS